MRSAGRGLEITRVIRSLLNGARNDTSRPAAGPTVARSVVAASGVALLGLAPTVPAVGLGQLQTRSSLGQPLRATVPLQLAAGESVRPGCVLAPPPASGGLKQPADTQVRTPSAIGPGNFNLDLSTSQPLYEPMYELTLRVDCPGLPAVMRHYVLMLDLPGISLVPAGTSPPAPALAAEPVAMANAPIASQRPTATSRGVLRRSNAPIAAGSRYRVREGDTLSTIASRIEGRRPNSTWELANRIFAANPRAFIRNDPNLIKLGAQIVLPDASSWSPETMPAQVDVAAPASLPTPDLPVPPAVQSEAPAALTNETRVATPAVEPEVATLTTPQADAAPAAADTLATVVRTNTVAGDSPFVDKQQAAPVPASGLPAAGADTNKPAQPLVLGDRPASEVSPLLAVLLGVLLGFGLSILLLRARLLEGLTALFARRRAAAAEETAYVDTDEWLKTEASLDSQPVALGTPAEETYVVEVSDDPEAAIMADTASAAEPTIETTGLVTDSAGYQNPVAAQSNQDEDEPELAELFADGLADLPDEPDLPDEVFGDVAGEPDSNLAPTAEMPQFDQSSTIIDPGVDDGPTQEMGALNDPDQTVDAELQGLAETQGDETKLSATLQEALSLLEQDFENELTASQIIDQSAIKQALDNDEEELEVAPRKRAG